MATFRFQLEPVLEHRRRVEDERQRELAVLLRERMILESQLRSMQQSLDEQKQRMGGALVGRVDVGFVRRHAAHATHVTARAQQIASKLMVLGRRIERAREQLLEAMRGRKAVERLKDKQRGRWAAARARREAAELDEITAQGYGRLEGGAGR